MRRIAAVVMTTVWLASASSALAQEEAVDDEAAARAHFESGRLHYENGDYEMALREFEAAYESSRRVELLYNLYVTTERLGRLDEAVSFLERFLAEGQPEAERRTQLERRLANLRERRDRQAASGETEEAPAPGGGGGRGDLLPAAIAFGVAGAGLLSFGIFGGLALAEDGALADGCGATASCSDAELSDLSTFNLAADVSWVLAAAAAAAGVVLLVTLGLDSGDETNARVVPLLSPSLAGVAGEVSF